MPTLCIVLNLPRMKFGALDYKVMQSHRGTIGFGIFWNQSINISLNFSNC